MIQVFKELIKVKTRATQFNKLNTWCNVPTGTIITINETKYSIWDAVYDQWLLKKVTKDQALSYLINTRQLSEDDARDFLFNATDLKKVTNKKYKQ